MNLRRFDGNRPPGRSNGSRPAAGASSSRTPRRAATGGSPKTATPAKGASRSNTAPSGAAPGGVSGKRRPSFTGRAAILAVVLAALAIALAGPLRALISQRAQLASLRADVKSDAQHLQDLQAQEKKWSDPAYVEAQARARLHYVRPGEVPYVTLAPTPAASPGAAPTQGSDEPWYAQLWSSIQGADAVPSATPAATSGPAPTPVHAPTPTPSAPASR